MILQKKERKESEGRLRILKGTLNVQFKFAKNNMGLILNLYLI
jgi:hypothetical protein